MPSTSPAHFPPLNQMLKDRSFSLFGHRRSCLTRLPPSGQAHCRAELVSALSLCCTGRTLSVVSICLWISPKAPSPLPVLPLMKRNGRVFITQRGPEKKRSEIRVQSSCNRTFQKRSSPLMAFLKPLQGCPFLRSNYEFLHVCSYKAEVHHHHRLRPARNRGGIRFASCKSRAQG